ncbi:MAG: transcriptional repressor [Ruminococcaceae bacterium]|nr:transcriptional repressor [Oscillospiraceae bacterium]
MDKYMTEQRRELMSFFKNNPDKSFTAKEVKSALKNAEISISAIYRNLARLEQDGYITRSVKNTSREIYYQSLISEKCRHCIHLNCVKCGNTFHMNHDICTELMQNVSERDGFKISSEKTVLYGVCGKCGGAESEEH